MEIIHVSGTMCSGKSYIIIPFLNHPDVAYWDILDLYKREKCLVDDKMVWDRWEVVKGMIIPELKKFLEQNKDKKICFIESGTNQTITRFLSAMNTTDIQLKTPSEDILTERAKERKLDLKQVLAFSDVFLKRHAHNDVNQYTQNEATLIIKAYLQGIRVSIIGTAGRKEDSSKMNKALYAKMYMKAVSILLGSYQIRAPYIHLVSGGAAWADHIAVSLYLGYHGKDLALYLPAMFTQSDGIKEACFYGHRDCVTANYYHKQFSEKMGGNTLEGISKAINKGATIKVIKGFKNRNLEVAKCDLMIAFTWGKGNKPKERSGTLHTWNHSNASIKIHIPLEELEEGS